MAQGAAFGVGSGVAHAAVNSVLGGGRSHGGGEAGAMGPGGEVQQTSSGAAQNYYDGSQEQVQESPCQSFNEMFLKCLQSHTDTIGTCQNQMDSLVQCERENNNIV